MNKIKIFFFMLVTASVGLSLLILALAVISENGQDISALIEELLGGHAPSGIPFFVPLSLILFFSATLASTVGVIYFLVMPEIINKKLPGNENYIEVSDLTGFLLPDERKVVEILLKHDGAYLQKYISKESGFTRLKTHRVIARLAERGIVITEVAGNTNLVKLSKTKKNKSLNFS
ncbi:MAG: hypothetical protein QXY52_01360 [Conexivisphaerales archaeon]